MDIFRGAASTTPLPPSLDRPAPRPARRAPRPACLPSSLPASARLDASPATLRPSAAACLDPSQPLPFLGSGLAGVAT